MCGLTGFYQHGNTWDERRLCAVVQSMADTLKLRGPDDSGEWTDANAGIALGFRRLAIVDLSPAGHQPMLSAPGRYVIAFNGEVYNFQELRARLEAEGVAPSFRGHSDTEVMLAAIEAWGLAKAVQSFVGMFAIALWDRQERTLALVRDRLGIKPLYYGRTGDTLLFGSELKALKAHPAFRGEIDRDALTLMMRHAYVPAPYSIYKNIRKLPAGTILTIPAGAEELPLPVPYWSARDVAEQGLREPFTGSEQDAIRQLDALLRESVALRMVADVPLGVFLSGGIDSTTVAALMQAQSARPVKTFTLGFHETAYDEAAHAKEIARHLGTEHTELYLQPEDALAAIPRMAHLYDEPFADSSQIPTYLVSELARRSVTVSLSGDGGDELFGGYNRYFWGRSVWKRIGKAPQSVRGAAGRLLSSLSPQTWDTVFSRLSLVLPARVRQRNPGDKMAKLAEVVGASSPEALYHTLVSQWKQPTAIVQNGREPATCLTNRETWAKLDDFTQRMMFLDTVTYLPDDILTKVDRASMGVSLEARVPLLDHRVVEFAWKLPLGLKIREGQGKWILRQVLHSYVPQELMERPKMGFGVPIDSWLRSPLRDWAEALLDETRLNREGYLHSAPIRLQWAEHLSGKRNCQHTLWNVLMFQAWLEHNKIF